MPVPENNAHLQANKNPVLVPVYFLFFLPVPFCVFPPLHTLHCNMAGRPEVTLEVAERCSLSAPVHQSLRQLCGHLGSWVFEGGRWSQAHRRQPTRILYCHNLSLSLTLKCIMHSVSPKAILRKPVTPDRADGVL